MNRKDRPSATDAIGSEALRNVVGYVALWAGAGLALTGIWAVTGFGLFWPALPMIVLAIAVGFWSNAALGEYSEYGIRRAMENYSPEATAAPGVRHFVKTRWSY